MNKSPRQVIKEQRRWMRDYIYSKIVDIPPNSDFKAHLRVIFAHHGLTVCKIGIKFLNSRDWIDMSKTAEYFKEIREFLEEIVK